MRRLINPSGELEQKWHGQLVRTKCQNVWKGGGNWFCNVRDCSTTPVQSTADGARTTGRYWREEELEIQFFPYFRSKKSALPPFNVRCRPVTRSKSAETREIDSRDWKNKTHFSSSGEIAEWRGRG